MIVWKTIFLLTFLGVIVTLASTTKESLECRANLTTAIKNESLFLAKIHQADYIFTGKIKELKANEVYVKVKRAIKGNLNGTMSLTLNDTCGFYVRKSYTGIFLASRDVSLSNFMYNPKIVMHFGPVPLTLANLDRVSAAVRVSIKGLKVFIHILALDNSYSALYLPTLISVPLLIFLIRRQRRAGVNNDALVTLLRARKTTVPFRPTSIG